MPVEVLLCSGDDASSQHRSVLRAIRTLNSLTNYIRMLRGLSPIHSTGWRRGKGLMWGTRGPYLPAAAIVGYGCVGRCWQLEANLRSTYCRNSKNCLRKYFFYSYVDPIYSWHLTRQLNKKDLDLCTSAFSWFLCPVFNESTEFTWRNLEGYPAQSGLICSSICNSVCSWVRAKRGVQSKRVFMRTFSFSVRWRNTTIIH